MEENNFSNAPFDTFSPFKIKCDNLFNKVAAVSSFEIPVFQDMPSNPAAAPGSGNNNCYLDSIKVYNGDTRIYFKTSFDRFTSSYTLKKELGAEKQQKENKARSTGSMKSAGSSARRDAFDEGWDAAY